VLPTLLFILWAYGMYALFTVVLQRKSGHCRGRNRWPRLVWLVPTGMVGAGLVLLIWLSFSPDQQHQNLKLTGFLGTVYAEGWPNKVDGSLEYPATKAQQNPGPGDQPVYTLLHPETPASQMEPEKKVPKPRPLRKTKASKTAANAKAKGNTAVAKKDKVTAKSKTKKKKKHTAAPAGNKSAAG
jgi:hypothetical protein